MLGHRGTHASAAENLTHRVLEIEDGVRLDAVLNDGIETPAE